MNVSDMFKKSPKMSSRVYVAVIGLILGIGFSYFALRSPKKSVETEVATVFDESVVVDTQESSAIIGGRFQLIDHHGVPRTDGDFAGKFLVVYFGYTFCPDICPTGLRSLTQALNTMTHEELTKIQPLFITIDPGRDTTSELQQFVSQYHPSLIALTGAERDIEKVAQDYKVYYQAHKNHQRGENYLVDHSSVFYIMSPTGAYCGHFTHVSSPKDMVQAIRRAMTDVKSK